MPNTTISGTTSIGQNPTTPSGVVSGAAEVFRYLEQEVRPQLQALERAIQAALNHTGDIQGKTNEAILLLQNIFDPQPKVVQLDAANQIENFAKIEERLNSVISVFENKHSDRENELVELAKKLKEQVAAASYVAQNSLHLEGKNLDTIKNEIATETNTKIAGALSEAKSYTDAQIISAVASAAKTAENLADVAKREANAYTDAAISALAQSATEYTDKKVSAASQECRLHLTTLESRVAQDEQDFNNSVGELDTRIADNLTFAKEQLKLLSDTISANKDSVDDFITQEFGVFKTNLTKRVDDMERDCATAHDKLNAAISANAASCSNSHSAIARVVSANAQAIVELFSDVGELKARPIISASGNIDFSHITDKITANTQAIAGLENRVSNLETLPPNTGSGGNTGTDPSGSGSGTTPTTPPDPQAPFIAQPTIAFDSTSGAIVASQIDKQNISESDYKLIIEIAKAQDFANAIIEQASNSATLTPTLQAATLYFARARYECGNESSAKSAIISFTTKAAVSGANNIVPPTIASQKQLVLTCSPYQVFYGTGSKDNLPSFEMAKLQSFGADGELNYTREFGTDVVGFTPTTSTLSSMTGAAANTDNISAVGFATPENAFKNDITTSSEVSSDKGSISYTYAAPQFLREIQVFAPRGSAPLSFKLWGQTDSGKNLLLHKTNVTYTDGASAKFAIDDLTNAYNTFIFEVVESESTRLCLIHKLCYYTQAAPQITIDLTNAQIPQGTYPMRVGFRSANGGYVFGAKQEITLSSSSDDFVGVLFREDLNMVRSLGTSFDKDWRLFQLSAAMQTAQTPEYLELSSKEVFKDIYPCVIDVAQDTIVKMPNATEAELTAELAKSAKNSLMVHIPKIYMIYGNLVCNSKTFEIIIIDTKPFSVTFTPDMLFMGEKSNAAITFSTLLNPSALGLQPLGKVVSGNNSAKITIQGCLHPAFYGQSKICDDIWLSAWWVTSAGVCKPMSHNAATREQWNANIAAALGQNFGAMRLWTFWDWHLISLLKRAGAQRQNGGRNGYAETCSAYNLRGHPSDWQVQNAVDSFFGLFNVHMQTYPTLIDGVFLNESSRVANETIPSDMRVGASNSYRKFNDCYSGNVDYTGVAVNVGYIDSASVNSPTSEFKNLGTNIKPLFNAAQHVRSTAYRNKNTATDNTPGWGTTERDRLLTLKMTNASIGIVNGCYGLFHPYAATASFHARTRFHHLRNRSADDVLF